MPKYVYHSSKGQGLKVVEPRMSTHGEAWVYAMAKPEHCAMFLGTHSDLILASGISNRKPVTVERFEGALEYAYKSKSGSIYKLDGKDFKSGMTSFDAELVCNHACEVLEENRIDDALQHILQLEAKGKIVIWRYPNRPPWVPKDKSDLVEKVVSWAQKPNSKLLERVRELHPDILDRVKERLAQEPNIVVQFVHVDTVWDKAAQAFEAEKQKLSEVLPSCAIEHVGSTAVLGALTKGDIDVNVRVRAEDFHPAVEKLKTLYDINQPNNWTTGFASFKDDSRNLGVQLTVLGSPDDIFVAQCDYLSAHPDTLAEYNALKRKFQGKSMDDYRKAKDEFFKKLKLSNVQ